MLNASTPVVEGRIEEISELDEADGRQTCELRISVTKQRSLETSVLSLAVDVFDQQAENCSLCLQEGRSVLIEISRLIQDDDGVRGIASAVLFIGLESHATLLSTD